MPVECSECGLVLPDAVNLEDPETRVRSAHQVNHCIKCGAEVQ